MKTEVVENAVEKFEGLSVSSVLESITYLAMGIAAAWCLIESFARLQ
jgi:uncharacterized membrane protein YuzA (DUF378 family)